MVPGGREGLVCSESIPGDVSRVFALLPIASLRNEIEAGLGSAARQGSGVFDSGLPTLSGLVTGFLGEAVHLAHGGQ